MNVTITPEIVVGTLTLLGAILLAIKKTGWLTIGPAPERRDCAKKCSDHEQVVAEAKLAVAKNLATSNALTEDIQDVKDGIKDLRDEVRQIEHNTQAEFRRIREMLGSLSGYVKGLHDRDN
jgi:septal ring factor EnvC (AmiA/AmiB activator)